jgi:hypothetical protein
MISLLTYCNSLEYSRPFLMCTEMPWTGSLFMIRVLMTEARACRALIETIASVDRSTMEYHEVTVMFDDSIEMLQPYCKEVDPCCVNEEMRDSIGETALPLRADTRAYFTARTDILFKHHSVPRKFEPFYTGSRLEPEAVDEAKADNRDDQRTTRSQASKRRDEEGTTTIEVIVPHYSERRGMDRFKHYHGPAPDPERAGEIMQTRHISASLTRPGRVNDVAFGYIQRQ